MKSTAYFFALLLSGLAMVPTLAHLFELPNKIGLPAEAYLTVQQNYRGWALFGIVIIGALIAIAWLALVVRAQARSFPFVLAAFFCILGTQAVFWGFTYPANAATAQWTMLPAGWEALRARWEYSHAASAALNFAAFVLLILAVLRREP